MSNARELAELGGSYGTGGFVGMKNRIINGAMMIDQRNAGASVTPATGAYTLDRWRTEQSGGGVYTVQQSTTAPTGFKNSLLVTVTTADASIAAGDYYDFEQFIEGFNAIDLAWGTASASPVTLSFWVRSSVVGTFAGSFVNSDANRAYVFTYTINAANTWEQKTVTVPGCTDGTWLTTNGRGIGLYFDLGNGSTYQGAAGSWLTSYAIGTSSSVKLISTVGATFYITGVQLEKGSTATSFDYRPYGTELALCQRYYQHMTASTSSSSYNSYGTGFVVASTYAFVQIPLLTPLRSAPTLTNATVSQFRVGFTTCTALSINSANHMNVSLRADVASGLTTGQGCQFDSNNNQTSFIGLSSEL